MGGAPFALKRVLSRGGGFVCGVCHQYHDTRGAAEDCLEACLQVYFSSIPVIAVAHGGKLSSRCRFCGREYERFEAAHHCAAECRSKFLGIREAERGAVPINLKALKGSPGKGRFMRRAVVAVTAARNPFAKRPADDEVNLREVDAASVAPAPSAPVAAAPATSKEDDAPSAPEKKKKDPKAEKFRREGANYVCTVCGKNYFTKVEVVACWDGHE